MATPPQNGLGRDNMSRDNDWASHRLPHELELRIPTSHVPLREDNKYCSFDIAMAPLGQRGQHKEHCPLVPLGREWYQYPKKLVNQLQGQLMRDFFEKDRQTDRIRESINKIYDELHNPKVPDTNARTPSTNYSFRVPDLPPRRAPPP